MLAERLRECHKQLYKLRIESLELYVGDEDDFTQEELEEWLENLLTKSREKGMEQFFKYVSNYSFFALYLI